MRRLHPTRGERGFALVETLASLVVIAMMSLLIIEGVGAGRQVWTHIDAREAQGETLEAAESALRDRIEQTYPATLYVSSPQTIDFHGGRDGLTFIASAPDSERPSPLRRYTLSLDAAGALALASVSDVDPRVAGLARRQVLLEGVRTLDIDYFGAAAPDGIRRWRPSWVEQQLPPELVRIRVGFEAGDPRRWPDLIVRPRVTIDAGCRINIATHHCQGRGA
jgi:general secretion pathway protein J